jgi:hypothetical protein
MCDTRAKERKRNAFVRTEEGVGAAWEAITRSPIKSMWRLAQQIGDSNNSAWKICRDDLSFPYNMQRSQPLSEDGKARRYAFVRTCGALLEDNRATLNVTRFSVEAYFQLDCCTNKKKMSDFGLQRIQGLPLPTHSIWSQLQDCIIERRNNRSS